MGLFDSLKAPKKELDQDRYVDLGNLLEEGKSQATQASMYVKVAEIHSYGDVRDLAGYVYDGDMLVLDISPILNDELTLKRVTNDLNALAQDTKGDVAGISDNIIVISPNGVKIDRKKIRATRGI
jgi:hypothetical protein